MALIKISGLIPTMLVYESMAPADPHTLVWLLGQPAAHLNLKNTEVGICSHCVGFSDFWQFPSLVIIQTTYNPLPLCRLCPDIGKHLGDFI